MSGFVLTPEEQADLNAMSGANGASGGSQPGAGSGFDDDGFSYDANEVDADDNEKGGWLDKEGQYHFEVTDVLFETSKQKWTPYIEFRLTVLHSVPGQSAEGSKFSHSCYLSEGARGMTSLFGNRIGALKMVPTGETDEKGQPRHKYVDAKTNATAITKATWLAAKGNQFIGLVVLRKERTDKATGQKFDAKLEVNGSKSWPVDAQEVADVPKNLQAMKLIGKVSAKPITPTPPIHPAAASTKAKPPVAKPAVATPATDDDLADL